MDIFSSVQPGISLSLSNLKKRAETTAAVLDTNPEASLSLSASALHKKRAETTAAVLDTNPEASLSLSASALHKKRAETAAAVFSADPEASLSVSASALHKKQVDPATGTAGLGSVQQQDPEASLSLSVSRGRAGTVESSFQFPSAPPVSGSADSTPAEKRRRANTAGSATPSPHPHHRGWSFGSKRYQRNKEAGQEEEFVDGGSRNWPPIRRSVCISFVCATPLFTKATPPLFPFLTLTS